MISIRDLNVVFDGFELKDINLDIGRNEFFVLMGPTGAGKTVLLESIAGITPLRSGNIRINGRDISTLVPEKRGVGIVYQDYALFPHMNVRENICFAARYHKMEKEELQRRLDKLCHDLNIGHLLDRSPVTLSGGEQQRTALARALMFEPSVLMLDEPLSALDPGFRLEIQELLLSLRESTDITFLMVTHDFSEALTLADRAAIMNQGRIEQVDDIQHLFRKPKTEFTADFVGMKNLFHVDFTEGRAVSGDLSIRLPGESMQSRGIVAIRPEDIILSPAGAETSGENSYRGKIASLVDRGFFFEVAVRVDGHIFTALVAKSAYAELEPAAGRDVCLSFPVEAVHSL